MTALTSRLNWFASTLACKEYLESSLNNGSSLARALISYVGSFDSFCTFLQDRPAPTTFNQGGHKPPRGSAITATSRLEEVDGDENSLAELVVMLAGRMPPAALLSERAGARRGDPFLMKLGSSIVYAGDAAIVVTREKELNTASGVLRGLRAATSLPRSQGFLVTGEAVTSSLLTPGSTLNAETLIALASATRVVYVSVYDGESYLVGFTKETARMVGNTL